PGGYLSAGAPGGRAARLLGGVARSIRCRDAAPAGTAGPAEQVLVLVHVSTARPRLKGVGRRRPETFGQAGAVQTADLLVRRSTRITALPAEIGRASCRERGEMSAGAGGAM